MYAYTYLYTLAHMYIHVHEDTCRYIHLHTCTHMYTHLHTCTHMYTDYMHVNTCTRMHTHVHTYIHTYMYTHVLWLNPYVVLQIPSLVCGPFGCGKTRTLRECIVLMLLHQPSAKMLICTHSNSAADLYVEDISREWNSEMHTYMCMCMNYNFSADFKKERLSLFRLFYTGRRYNTVTHIVRQYSR